MDRAQVGVLKETHQIGLGGFLEGQDGRSLEAQITLEILGNLTNQTLERKLSDEEVRALLVPANLAEGNGSGSVSVGLLDSSGGGGGLASGLGGELFAGSLSSGRLASGLEVNRRSKTKESKYIRNMRSREDIDRSIDIFVTFYYFRRFKEISKVVLFPEILIKRCCDTYLFSSSHGDYYKAIMY